MQAKGRQPNSISKSLVGLAIGVLLIGLTSVLLKNFESEENLYSAALVFVVIVLWITSRYGLGAGLAISILGLLSLDYFFTQPYYTLAITSPAEIIAVGSFFAAAIVTSQIAERARRKTEEEQARAQEIATLNQLNVAILSEVSAPAILNRLVKEIAIQLTALNAVLYLRNRNPSSNAFELAATYTNSEISDISLIVTEPHSHNEENITLARQALTHNKIGYRRLQNNVYLVYLPLITVQQPLGVLVLAFLQHDKTTEEAPGLTSEMQHWLTVVANQAALAVEHASLIEETAHITSLREADRLKSALLASVSHELRTPLTSIKTAVAGLRDEEVLLEKEEEQEYLELIDEEADRLTRLITNLLDLSRIEAGTLKPDKGLYYLPEIANQTIERMERLRLLNQHRIETNYAPDLPLINVDYLQIEEVLTNLLENAIKYSPVNTKITVSIKLAARPEIAKNIASSEVYNKGLQVEVADEGIGVPSGELDLIFEKFYRVNQNNNASTFNEVQGNGLGLAICKGIIEAHQGFIWASSRPLHTGATFTFWLPCITVTGENKL